MSRAATDASAVFSPDLPAAVGAKPRHLPRRPMRDIWLTAAIVVGLINICFLLLDGPAGPADSLLVAVGAMFAVIGFGAAMLPPRHAPAHAAPVALGEQAAQCGAILAAAAGETPTGPSGLHDPTEDDGTEALWQQTENVEAVGRLAAGVAHDLNNILHAVVGGLDLVMDEIAPDAPARQFAKAALNAATRGSRLTHHLMAYAGQLMLWPQAIELEGFLTGIEEQLSRTLGPDIAIHVRVKGAPSVFADPGELQTALRNLAINAAQAMPAGGTLLIDARAERVPGLPRVTITVTDTGSGMDEATLHHAAEPFFTTKGQSCTGLGLSMVQGFVAQSRGALRITSMPGRGTTVEIRLPPAAADVL